MKKRLTHSLIIAVLLAGIFTAFSCKRCSTCTYDDPIYGADTSDFCGSGNTYKEQLEQHEKNGWICVEN